VSTGKNGERLAELLLEEYTSQGQLFDCHLIGGTWPAIDIYVELRTPEKMFFFVQVKATTQPIIQSTNKIITGIKKRDLNRMSGFHAPTYFIGVHFVQGNMLTTTAGYIKCIRGNYNNGFARTERINQLTPNNLIQLKKEVEDFWNNTNTKAQKLAYNTNFE